MAKRKRTDRQAMEKNNNKTKYLTKSRGECNCSSKVRSCCSFSSPRCEAYVAHLVTILTLPIQISTYGAAVLPLKKLNDS